MHIIYVQVKFQKNIISVIKGVKMYQFEEKEIRRNKTNIFVRKCITEALFSLLEKHDFEDISITDIIKKAGVSRMGFYRNYSSKEDVIEKFILEKFIETINEIKAKRQLNFHINNIMITTLKNFQKFSNYIKLFLDKNLDALLYKCYHNAYYSLYNIKKNNRIHQYSNEMFIGELFNLEMCWLKNGMKESPEELARIYGYIMKLRISTNNLT